MTAVKEIPKYALNLVGVRKSDGTEMTLSQQANINFFMKRGMRIMN
jgi:hypothetical protein